MALCSWQVGGEEVDALQHLVDLASGSDPSDEDGDIDAMLGCASSDSNGAQNRLAQQRKASHAARMSHARGIKKALRKHMAAKHATDLAQPIDPADEPLPATTFNLIRGEEDLRLTTRQVNEAVFSRPKDNRGN